MTEGTKLCDRCREIFQAGRDVPDQFKKKRVTEYTEQAIATSAPKGWTAVAGFVHEHKTIGKKTTAASFADSVRSGCYICTSLCRRYRRYLRTSAKHVDREDLFALERAKGYPPVRELEWYLFARGPYPRDILEIAIVAEKNRTVEGGSTYKRDIFYTFTAYQKSRLRDMNVLPQIELPGSTRTLQSMQQVSEWIRGCVENHPECQSFPARHRQPTRLIYIQKQKLDEEESLKALICSGGRVPPGARYLTLSHCWGKRNFLRSTRSNITAFEKDIPIHLLTPSFRDAIYITSKLGLEYLWIDSLCILQDDPDDWKQESQIMGEIYKGALCNIAATGSSNKRRGFLLKQRKPQAITPPWVHIDWHEMGPPPWALIELDGKTFSLWGNNRVERDFILDEKDKLQYLREDILYTRAWVFQEQLLSPRILHCQDDQLYWECNAKLCNEVWPHGFPKRYPDDVHSFMKQWRLTSPEMATRLGRNDWVRIVRHFMTLDITFPSDRLPALAGIAEEYQTLLKDKYLYGLWEQDLHHGLLWRLSPGQHQQLEDEEAGNWDGRADRRQRENPQEKLIHVVNPRSDTLPNWSWASLEQHVDWPYSLHMGIMEKRCRIEVENTPDRKSLRITGSLMRLKHSKQYSPNHIRWDLICDYWFALQRFQSGKPSMERVLDQELWYMPILCTSSSREVSSIRWQAFGLLLHAEGPGVYRRVGVGDFSDHLTEPGVYKALGNGDLADNLKTGSDRFEGYIKECQTGIEESHFLEADGVGRYSIRLV